MNQNEEWDVSEETETETEAVAPTEVPITTTAAGPMSATVHRKELLNAVQAASRAVTNRTSLPILTHLLLETKIGADGDHALHLSGTDLELGVSTSMPAYATAPGGLTVPAKLLSDLLGSLTEDEVTLTVDRSHAAHIKSGKSEYRLLGLPAEEYPILPDLMCAAQIVVPQKLLREMIQQTVYAVSDDQTRAILTGVYFIVIAERLRLVATDTHRLAMRVVSIEGQEADRTAIVPERTCRMVLAMLSDADGDVTITFSQSQALFTMPDETTKVITRLIDGQYPNYERVIPKPAENSFTVDRQALAKAVKRAEVIVKDAAHRVILQSKAGLAPSLVISGESATSGNALEEIDAEVAGVEFTVAFNGAYLLDALNAITSEKIIISVDGMKPGLLLPVDDAAEYTCVLMPMQLS